MRKIDDPFLASYPNIDLHGCTIVEARIKTMTFIKDSLKLKNYDIIIMHGKGTGVVKLAVHDILRKDKHVVSYKTDYYNDGITIVKLKEYV